MRAGCWAFSMVLLASVLTTVAEPIQPGVENPCSHARRSRSDFFERVRSATRHCGQHSLYMMMNMHGFRVSLNEVVSAVELKSSDTAASLLDLRVGADKLGFSSEIQKFDSVDDLQKCPQPLIVHYEGHFALLCSIGETVALVDGSTARHYEMSSDCFENRWTGYVLTVKTRNNTNVWVYTITTVLTLYAVFCCNMLKCRRTL